MKIWYNIQKWVIFIGGLITTIIYFIFAEELGGAFIFIVASFFCFVGPRLENSMDRVYCGQELACHKILNWDVWALFFLLIEWAIMICCLTSS